MTAFARAGDDRHRLLAIDGGGVRGVIALEIIARIEAELREQTGDPDLRLGDWFDYIAGTSTGAIIAAALATGRTAADVMNLYESHAHAIFRPARGLARLRHRYDHRGLTALLKREFGADTTLGSPLLRSLLMIGLRNASTDSPWPLSSNPTAVFNTPDAPNSNLHVPLWQAVRASTAAPTYFPTEHITLGDSTFSFSDGATTPLNNPALQLLLMATLPEYRLEWPTGEENLLLVSVGTGSSSRPTAGAHTRDPMLWDHALGVPGSLMHSVGVQQDMVCRALARVRHGAPLDAEVGAVAGVPAGAGPLLTYVRYDVDLAAHGEELRSIDAVRAIPALRAVGLVASQAVAPEHFAGFADAATGTNRKAPPDERGA